MEEDNKSVTTNGSGAGERPTTPSTPSIHIFNKITQSDDEWWRPSHPPETYKWEEVRRQRKKGGYPWTLLDNENDNDEIDANEFLDDNLYEPVNPPPLHDTGSAVFYGKDTTDTGSLDGRRRIDIPPEIEIVNSEGLDGLDQPDPHDYGMDGDREWVHSDDEQVVPSSKICFTAGIRGGDDKATNKTISFDPATKNGSYDEDLEDEGMLDIPQEVPSGSRSGRSRSRSRSPNPTGPPKKTTTAFEILKNKAADAAGQVKQRFNKIALPTRPKLSQGEGFKLARGKKNGKKGKHPPAPGEEDQVAPMEEEGVEDVPALDQLALPKPDDFFPPAGDDMDDEEPISTSSSVKEAQAQAAELARKEKEAAVEEKKRKQKEADELKKQKAEEKKREAEEKKREADELKRQKAEEKAKAKEEADKKKAEEKALKAKLAEEAKKAKLEEQLAKAREQEEQERLKNEELLRLREQEAAARSAAGAFDEYPAESPLPPEDIPADMEEDEEQIKDVPTPTGTGSRKKKIKKTFVQLPKLPDIPRPTLPSFDLDFKRKVIKRSKTPPARPTPPKLKQRRGLEEETAENQLAAQYAGEIAARKLEFEQDEETGGPPIVRSVQFPQTPIFVTQPSTENNSVTTETESVPKKGTPSYRSDDVMDDETSSYPGPSGDKPQPASTKERFDKFGQQVKTFSQKSKDIASKKSKAMGATMKVIGKDLQKFGVKTSEKFQATIEEIKQKQEAAKARTKELQAQKAKEAEDAMAPHGDDAGEEEEPILHTDYATEPRRKFRFRRRDDSQEESQHQSREEEDHVDDVATSSPYPPPDQQQGADGDKITRSQLLGRAERDWESPLDELASRSRDVSEDRGNVSSSRDSPPGSSLASSTFGPHVATGGPPPPGGDAHIRKRGVLEEIDSDEFFLREKGISEGEDEEEINRFLVEELRQAFRFQENALAGFDLDPEEAPQRPGRQPRKPARKEKSGDPSYQTFPPERPRRKAPGYVSDYIKEQGGEGGDEEAGRRSYLEEEEDLEEFGDDNTRRVIKDDLEDLEHQIVQQFVDDGRYEPVVGGGGAEPVKPTRSRRNKKKPDAGEGGSPLYYNTVAGNDWMRDEEQATTTSAPAQVDSEDVTFVDAQDHSQQDRGGDDDADFDDMEYVDDAGYAVVRKEARPAPRTVPRSKKNKRGGSSKGSSLKRQQGSVSPDAAAATAAPGASTSSDAFFSLPRFTPRSLHIIPPSRPQRNYSTLRPRRPPRQGRSSHTPTKAAGAAPKDGDKAGRGDGATSPGGSRPSTAIGIMQGRPLPAIPSTERPPRLNDLDQSSIERAVGARHYANFVEEAACVATNIPLLGAAGGDVNIAIQTDPVQAYDEDEAAAGGQRQSDSQTTGPTETTAGLKPQQRAYSTGRVNQGGDGDAQQQRPLSSAASGEGFPSDHQFQFPRRLHLHELEVDVLRVHDLSAHSITADSLRASQIEVNSLTSTGPLTVSSIHTQTLNSDQVNCNRLASDTVDLPTMVPPAFYNLSSPPDDKGAPDKKEELRRDPETDLPCPYTPFEDDENMDDFGGKGDNSVGSPIGDFFGRSLEFCLTPEQSVDNDDSWGHQIPPQKGEETTTSSTRVEDDVAHCSELPCDESSGTEPTLSSTSTGEQEQEPEKPATFALDRHSFRIAAVLENDDSVEEEDKKEDLNFYLQDEAPVLSGSLRLEYRRSPEVPSDFQVLHDIVETEEANFAAPKSSPTPPPPQQQARPEVTRGPSPLIAPPPQLVPSRVEQQPEVMPPPPTLPPRQFPPPPSSRGSTNLSERRTISTESSSSGSGERSSESFSRTTSSSREPSTIRVSESSSTAIVPPVAQLQVLEGQVEVDHGDETLVAMSIRFVHVVTRVMMRGLQAIVDYVDIATTDDPSKAEEQRAHMQVLLCLLLILLAGIILSSSNSVVSFSPPKWEFLMPPPHL
ncbi:uncharacterized protein LOC110857018 isoform X1 [Folsomia candida]|uniref:uncharacterized protein LOC110857018 isoform X1 n=1 Tax=Folsomia candida TaxID=158441 RepID=UPI000B8FEAA8|nr:uncharacterized protein LOC110857018 isoform X1 [Folsomia candida]